MQQPLRIFLLLFLLSLGTSTSAQQQSIPLPNSSGTHNDQPTSLGYWFQADTCFSLTGVWVSSFPAIANLPQNVQIVRLNSTPPGFPSQTGNFSTEVLIQNGAPQDTLPINVLVQKGDIIGVMGMRGDTARRSFNTGGSFNTSVLGKPLTLRTLVGLQSVQDSAVAEVRTENIEFGLVELFFEEGFEAGFDTLQLAGDTVQFIPRSTELTNTWTVNGQTPQTVDTLTLVLDSVGTYVVELDQANACGTIADTTDTLQICVDVGTAAFNTTLQTPADTGHTVSFTNTSQLNDSANTAFLWNFGDGGFSSQPNPTHTYTQSGPQLATLRIVHTLCQDTDTLTQPLATCLRPQVSITNTSILGPQLTASASASSDAPPVALSWDFGDGNLATGDTVTNVYANNGSFSLRVLATNNCGSTAGDTLAINICRPPVAAFTANAGGASVNLDETTSDDTMSIAQFRWQINGGAFQPASGDTTFVPPSPDSLVACLEVTNTCGARDTLCQTIGITARPDLTRLGVRVFPNPARDVLRLDLSELRGEVRLELHATDGRRVLVRDLRGGGLRQLALPEELASGVYQLWLSSEAGVLRQKLLLR